MGDKSLQKKKLILDTAREVFMAKGFRDVTMKDIVEACGISRGGLYLYYASTEEVFLDVLKQESAEDEAVSPMENASASDMLALFFKEQKKAILKSRKSLAAAEYEYMFSQGKEKKDSQFRKKFNEAVYMLEKLIEMGIKNGEFYDVDARIAAKNIMYVLEGLKISSLTIGVSGETIDKELLILMQGLVIEE